MRKKLYIRSSYILISGDNVSICSVGTYGGLLTTKSKGFEFKSKFAGPFNTVKNSILPSSFRTACTTVTWFFKPSRSRLSLVNSHACRFESIAMQFT